jgi:hypothetical protein
MISRSWQAASSWVMANSVILPYFACLYDFFFPDNNATKHVLPGGIEDLSGKVPQKFSL